jgi:hypothetical protein
MVHTNVGVSGLDGEREGRRFKQWESGFWMLWQTGRREICDLVSIIFQTTAEMDANRSDNLAQLSLITYHKFLRINPKKHA